MADALLTILREVDARLEAPEGDDDSLGRYVGLLGLGANGPLEARDLAALAPTTTWRDWVPVAAAPSDPDAANAAKRDRPGATLPTFYGARGGDGDGDCDAPQCYVCLEAFRGGEEIRELPCRHAFHRACVDKWLLRSSRKCPTCRAEVPRAPRRFDAADEFGNEFGNEREPTSRNPASVGSPASATLQPRGGVLALPPTRPNLFFLPAPEGFEPGAVPERVASPAPRTRA